MFSLLNEGKRSRSARDAPNTAACACFLRTCDASGYATGKAHIFDPALSLIRLWSDQVFRKTVIGDQIMAAASALIADQAMESALPDHVQAKRELTAAQTHCIGLRPGNRLHAQSAGRGWRNVYAAKATVNGWSGVLEPLDHYCVAFCLDRPARLSRVVGDGSRPETRTVLPRQFFIIPAHEPSEWRRAGPSEMLMLYLRREMLEALGRELAMREADAIRLEPEFGATDVLLEQLAMGILRVLDGPPGAGESLYVDTLAQSVAAHLLRRAGVAASEGAAPVDAPRARRLARARDYIDAHLGESLSIDVLAREAGMGIHAFPKAFLRQFGKTPHQFVLERRLERAMAILAGTDLPIAEIALHCGFSSQSHLSAVFRQRKGHSPAAYRRAGAG